MSTLGTTIFSGTNLDLEFLDDEDNDQDEGQDDDSSDKKSPDDSSDSEEDADDSEGEDADDSDPVWADGDTGEGDNDDAGGEKANGLNPNATGAGDPDPFRDLRDLMEALQAEMMTGETTDLLDNNQALAQKVDAEHGEIQDDEALWRPAEPERDSVIYPRTDADDTDKATDLLLEARAESAAIQSLLRTRFLSNRQPKVTHGVRKGNGLSSRRLVATMVELRAGSKPSRPELLREKAPQISLATLLVVDQSGSMSYRRQLAARTALAITSALDALGSPVMSIGFRHTSGVRSSQWQSGCHRSRPVTIDIFKDWHERLRDTVGRFNKVQAVHFTPMSDGIQYGLQELNARPERHRVMLVLTDGEPDVSPVVRRQVRLAREAGITVVGVGIDDGCAAVRSLFDMCLVVENEGELPRKLLGALTEIVFPSRTRQVALDGRMQSALTS